MADIDEIKSRKMSKWFTDCYFKTINGKKQLVLKYEYNANYIIPDNEKIDIADFISSFINDEIVYVNVKIPIYGFIKSIKLLDGTFDRDLEFEVVIEIK